VPVDEASGAKAGEVQALVERLKREQCGTPVPSPVRMERYLPFYKLIAPGLNEPLVIKVLYLSLTSQRQLACHGCGSREGQFWQGRNGCERWPGVHTGASVRTQELLEDFFTQLDPPNVENVMFNGGNPLCEVELLEYAIRRLKARSQPPRVIVTTNGLGAEPRVFDWMAELGVIINFVLTGGASECERAGAAREAFDGVMDPSAAAGTLDTTLCDAKSGRRRRGAGGAAPGMGQDPRRQPRVHIRAVSSLSRWRCRAAAASGDDRSGARSTDRSGTALR